MTSTLHANQLYWPLCGTILLHYSDSATDSFIDPITGLSYIFTRPTSKTLPHNPTQSPSQTMNRLCHIYISVTTVENIHFDTFRGE